jgi:hypothetical protein
MNDKVSLNHQAILIENLMEAPFIAAASANSTMAKEQMKFLMESCFDLKDGNFSPKMISLTFKSAKSTKEGVAPESSTFELPLITVIPFNSLCVKDISVKFDLEIVSHVSHSLNEGKSGGDKVQMRGSVSSSNDGAEKSENKKRNQSKMHVEITGGSIPLPIGLTTLLDLYSKNIKLKS